jgi:major histocompatibility complex class I
MRKEKRKKKKKKKKKKNRLITNNKIQVVKPGMVAHAFKPSIQEAEAGRFLSSRPAWSTK